MTFGFLKDSSNEEKPAYPPAYNEIYPTMNNANAPPEMGWQPQPPIVPPPPTMIDSQENNLSITPRQSSKLKTVYLKSTIEVEKNV